MGKRDGCLSGGSILQADCSGCGAWLYCLEGSDDGWSEKEARPNNSRERSR